MLTGLRVATYNLYLGADLALLFGATDLADLTARTARVRRQLAATRFPERARAVAVILARERPDLVGLQEVARWTTAPLARDGGPGEQRVLADFLAVLVDALAEAGCGYDVHAVTPGFSGALPVSGTEWIGVAGASVTLVRRDGPVEVVRETTATYDRNHVVVTGLDGVTFPVLRGWGCLDVRVAGRLLRFVNTHTEAYDAATRDAQRDELLCRVGYPGTPVVLVGDLNAVPAAVGIPEPWQDAWSAGDGAGPTCGQDPDLANPDSRLRERIDYVWTRGARVLACRVVGDRAEDRSVPHELWPSDHAAVVADLEV